jgi:hypothetical protein
MLLASESVTYTIHLFSNCGPQLHASISIHRFIAIHHGFVQVVQLLRIPQEGKEIASDRIAGDAAVLTGSHRVINRG